MYCYITQCTRVLTNTGKRKKTKEKERRENKIKWLNWERGAKQSLHSTRKLVPQQSFHYATIHLRLVGKRTSRRINISPARMCQLDLVIFHFCRQEVRKRRERESSAAASQPGRWEKQFSILPANPSHLFFIIIIIIFKPPAIIMLVLMATSPLTL